MTMRIERTSKTQCRISEDVRLVEYSMVIIQRERESEGGGEKINVLTIEWKSRGEPGLAEDEQKAQDYVHKVDLAPLNMHIGLDRRS